MKKLAFILLLLSFSAFAKKEEVVLPIWFTMHGRETVAPSSEYFSAFAQERYYSQQLEEKEEIEK